MEIKLEHTRKLLEEAEKKGEQELKRILQERQTQGKSGNKELAALGGRVERDVYRELGKTLEMDGIRNPNRIIVQIKASHRPLSLVGAPLISEKGSAHQEPEFQRAVIEEIYEKDNTKYARILLGGLGGVGGAALVLVLPFSSWAILVAFLSAIAVVVTAGKALSREEKAKKKSGVRRKSEKEREDREMRMYENTLLKENYRIMKEWFAELLKELREAVGQSMRDRS